MDPTIEYCTKILIPHIDRTLAKIEEMHGKGEKIEVLLFPEVESRILYFITRCFLKYKYAGLKPKLLKIMASDRLLGGIRKNRKNWELVNSSVFYEKFKEHCKDATPYDKLNGVKGKKVAIIDDVIETGRTIRDICLYVRELGGEVRLVSAIESEEESAKKIERQLKCKVLYAHPFGRSLSKFNRSKEPGFRVLSLGISILFSPEGNLAVSQKNFSQLYDELKADDTFNIAGLLLLKNELAKTVKRLGISKEELKKARWTDEPYSRMLEKLFGRKANEFLFSLNRKEWFEEDNKDLEITIFGIGKGGQMISDKLIALRKSRPKPEEEIKELADTIKEEEGRYRDVLHPFEFTPYKLRTLKIYSCPTETRRKVSALKKILEKHINGK